MARSDNDHLRNGLYPRSSESCLHLTHDAKVCPRCFGKMEYDFFHYNHIGSFHCPTCGYHTPEPDYLADQVDFESGDFTVNGLPAHVNYPTPFHFMNTTAAVAVCCTAGCRWTRPWLQPAPLRSAGNGMTSSMWMGARQC